MSKYTMEQAHTSRALSASTPRDCLNRSRYVLLSLFRAGDRVKIDGESKVVAEKLRDEDGELVMLFEDGTHIEIPPPAKP